MAVYTGMSFFLDYITNLDISCLKASEVSQCLLYLNHIAKYHPELEQQITPTKERLNGRLQTLREERKHRGGRTPARDSSS